MLQGLLSSDYVPWYVRSLFEIITGVILGDSYWGCIYAIENFSTIHLHPFLSRISLVVAFVCLGL